VAVTYFKTLFEHFLKTFEGKH